MLIKVCAAGVLAFLCQSAMAIDDTPAEYRIKESEPQTGSHIRRDSFTGSGIPLNKRYAELSAAQKSMLRARYETMAPDDEPPFPVNGMMHINKSIQEGNAILHEEGALRMVVKIDSKGDATTVEVLSSPSEKMTKLAAAILMLEKYKPALCHGVACSMQFPYNADFVIRH
ncbi:MAG TPA: hypothetical protein DCW29_09075 [Janthinobacterium sp.]|nr:hypothetical protein [Janthinobacterium sp.]